TRSRTESSSATGARHSAVSPTHPSASCTSPKSSATPPAVSTTSRLSRRARIMRSTAPAVSPVLPAAWVSRIAARGRSCAQVVEGASNSNEHQTSARMRPSEPSGIAVVLSVDGLGDSVRAELELLERLSNRDRVSAAQEGPERFDILRHRLDHRLRHQLRELRYRAFGRV